MARMTHSYDGELVVFHIGMTIKKWWRPDVWMPVSASMPKMLGELFSDPESGLLGSTMLLGRRGPYLVQYWSSLEKLYAYASAPEQAHRPAWTSFNRNARKHPGAIGVWHETYRVAAAESIYVDTPPMGLGAATRLVEIGRRHDRARARLEDGATS
ncbi:DUF4188 domain-containing protein [Microbacterium sp. KSW-18]|uniref:DUF4188 domain-containing protein n=1 Tax=Microbacterium aquilitoris TaxID=3067307 RepID=A0ABU3GHF9_9MICO|nr:DUF4188 domain-containing protein [Microbacterium sp. KSW-18]MDT3329311.1 DUF4188 domain-containing protein [Microbacterium sp. KSW-18]